MRHSILSILALTFVVACGGGGGGGNSLPSPPLPDGVPVETPAFETYPTDHNGYSRVRLDQAAPEDAPVLAAFDDGDHPAGYRSLVALNEALYDGRMMIEVIGEVDSEDGSVQRLLRMTVDQSPFEHGQLVAASGRFHLRGPNFSWVTIDGGPILSGNDAGGLVHMTLDFDKETASLHHLRTGVDDISQVRTDIVAQDLPFNIRSGAYGGDVLIHVWDPHSPDILAVDGSLRGEVGGSPTYADHLHNLSTSGLYTASGTDEDTGRFLTVDGAFTGIHPNALRSAP